MLESLNNFTENMLQGNGVFDRIMNSVELHIHDEYSKSRITGSSYAQAYISCIQAVLQASTQIALESDKLALELEKLKLEIEQGKIQVEIAKQQLEIAKAQLEQAKLNNELIHWKAVSEQAQTCDIINNGEEPYAGETSNTHGVIRAQLDNVKETTEASKKKSMLDFAKETVINTYHVIESAEGVGASKFGLNGSNAIDILNKLRSTFGVSELDTDKYSGEHKQYMNTYAPDVTLEDSEN